MTTVSDDEVAIIGHAVALLEALGEKPSIRRIDAIVKVAHGKRGMRWATIAAGLKLLPGNTSGNTDATVGQQFYGEPATVGQQPGKATCASADHNGVVVASASSDTGNPYPLTTFGDVSPEGVVASEPVVAKAPALFPALTLVPDRHPAPKPAHTVAAQDPLTDFGDFEPDVRAIIAVEASHRRSKSLGEDGEKRARQSLALWRRKHGDAAFARGLEVGIESGKGLKYGRGAMERFDPDEIHATPSRAFAGPIREAPCDPPLAIDLIAEARARGKIIPPLVIPPCERRPGSEGYLRYRDCPHCAEAAARRAARRQTA